MLRTSEAHGKKFEEVFTKEAYNRLKRDEAFRLNLETMEYEYLPEVITIPPYDVVIFSTRVSRGHKFVLINDFLDITFPFELLQLPYEKLLEELKKSIDNKQ